MLPVTVNQEISMSSLDFLTNYINPARKDAGQSEQRHNELLIKIRDEFDEKVIYGKTVDSKNREIIVIELNYDQMLLVGMRESKAVRKAVLEKLKELVQQKPMTQIELLANVAMSLVQQEKRLLAQETMAVETLTKVLEQDTKLNDIGKKVDKIKDLTDQVLFGHISISEGYRKYCNVCSYDVFREFANSFGLPLKPLRYVPTGTVAIVDTHQVRISDLEKMRNAIVQEATQISPHFWKHPSLPHKFKLRA